MKTSKKLNDFVCFVFPFTSDLKKLHFLHFQLMIILLVTCLIMNIFSGSLVNGTFSKLKLNICIIIFTVICSNKYVKQVDLINHSLISPTLQRGWELENCLFSKK